MERENTGDKPETSGRRERNTGGDTERERRNMEIQRGKTGKEKIHRENEKEVETERQEKNKDPESDKEKEMQRQKEKNIRQRRKESEQDGHKCPLLGMTVTSVGTALFWAG